MELVSLGLYWWHPITWLLRREIRLAEEKKTTSSEPSGVFVPTTAVRDDDGKKIVLIAFNGKVLKREVQVVSQRSGGLIVKGLVGGENVITAGPPNLKDGDKIKIKGQS